jgi:FkbM family methyltransferase
MSESQLHPAVVAFESLLALRQYVATNPNDGVANFATFCASNLVRSHSQLFQDLFVVFLLQAKRNGFFVEFGATNGVDLSNTVILERDLQWNGILAEPARGWHSALKANRRAAIDTRCVWSESGAQLEFKETDIKELSTLSSLVDKDFNRGGRLKGTPYSVDTISLNDLLRFHNSPKEIDYVSIDTEGSELAILQAFDFSNYDIKIMTVEHNFCEPDRHQIDQLLTSKGFIRLFWGLSRFDDWYVKKSIVGF